MRTHISENGVILSVRALFSDLGTVPGCHSVRAFISKNRGHSVREHFKNGGHIVGESKMSKIKRGSFSDRWFENGGQCGCTFRHLFLGSAPGYLESIADDKVEIGEDRTKENYTGLKALIELIYNT